MKKLLVVLMGVAALTGLMVVPVFAQETNKLIVRDAGNTTDVFSVGDAGTLIGVKAFFGNYATPARGVRALNLIGDVGGMRLWRVHPSWPPTMEFLNSAPGTPDTIVSWWDVYAGFQWGPSMFCIRDRGIGDINRMTIGSNGYIGFSTGTSAPAYPLQFGAQANGAYLSAGGVWTNGSSREYKDNIELLSAEKAFDTIKNLNPVTYAYKADPTEKHVGFIAEDVPDLVATNDRQHLSPMDIVAVLTKVVQEQNKMIEALSAKIDMLEKVTAE